MNDERMIVLQMLEKGKITAEEAAALLEALRSDSDLDNEEEGHASSTEFSDDAGARAKEYVDKTRERVEDGIKKLRETLREKGPGRDDIDNFAKQLQKGISRVIDELPDVVTRLSNFDFRGGPKHEFETVFTGTLSPDKQPRIRVHNPHGRISVEEGEGPTYQVKVIHKVYAEDEEKAKAIADDAIDWHASDSGFELTTKKNNKVSSDLYIVLPRDIKYDAELVNYAGSIRWQDLLASHLQLTSKHGSIKLERTQADRIHARTSNGSVNVKHIHGEYVEVATINGSIRLDGFSQYLRCQTSQGSVRANIHPPSETPEDPMHWDLNSVNGSVRVAVPTGDEYGHQLDLRTKNGRISIDLPDVTSTEPVAASHFTGQTTAYDARSRHLRLTVRTSNGSISIDPVDQEEGA